MNTGGSAASIVGVLLPAALALIMLYLGLTLRLADFQAVARRPRALAVGLAGQMLLLPLAAVAVAWATGLPALMALGLLVLAACPGGVSSGLLTHLAQGETALSIALTAITSVAAMASLPLVMQLAAPLFPAEAGAGAAALPALPIAQTIKSVLLLTTVPVLLGMALRARWPQAVQRVEPVASRLATALFVAVVLATFASQREVLLAQLPRVGPAALLLNVAALAGGWALARAFSLTRRESIAVATECGLQNSALGIYVCVQLLHSPAMAVPSVVYALLMNLGAIAFVLLVRRGAAAVPGATAAARP